jgi:hypothetical protein
MIATQKVKNRRRLRFENFDDVIRDAELHLSFFQPK